MKQDRRKAKPAAEATPQPPEAISIVAPPNPQADMPVTLRHPTEANVSQDGQPQNPDKLVFICPHCKQSLENVTWRILEGNLGNICIIVCSKCLNVIGANLLPPARLPRSPFGI